MHPVCLGAWPAGPFYPAAADPRLPYRRVFHWSIRHGMGQFQGVDQRHLRTRPDLHAVHDRAGNRPEKDRARRQGHPVRRRRAIGRRLPARHPVLLGIGLSMGGGPFRRALSLHRLRALLDRHHRQGAVREARARYAARPHHARRAGAAGHLRDPVPGGAAEPRQSADQRDPDLDRPGRRAGGDRAGAQPLSCCQDCSTRSRGGRS